MLKKFFNIFAIFQKLFICYFTLLFASYTPERKIKKRKKCRNDEITIFEILRNSLSVDRYCEN